MSATSDPRLARRTAIAAPMPRLAPVTSAARSANGRARVDTSGEPVFAEHIVAQILRWVRSGASHVLCQSIDEWNKTPDQIAALVPQDALEVVIQRLPLGRVEFGARLVEQLVERRDVPVSLVIRRTLHDGLLHPLRNRVGIPLRLPKSILEVP